MTPPASAAARSTATKRPATASRAAARTAAKRPGPNARAVARTAAALPATAPGAPGTRRTSRRAPRRVSGPSRGLVATVAAVATPRGSLARRVSLQRLTHTRAWIGVVAFALIGIVTMQVLLLKLNTGIGDSLAQATSLQRENAALSIATSEEGAPEAIEEAAHNAGMLAIAPGELNFIRSGGPGDARRAAKALRASSASSSSVASTTTAPVEAEAEALAGGTAEGEEASAEAEAPVEAAEAPSEYAPAEADEADEAEYAPAEPEYASAEAEYAPAEPEYAPAEPEYAPDEAEAGTEAADEAEAAYSSGSVSAGGVPAGTEG